MKNYIEHNDWCIIESEFYPSYSRESESIFSIGNGRFGQRANFEEHYSGHTLQGSYVAGIYYPDKTKVGWWKNGYPAYFAKVLNAPNWIGIDVDFEGEVLDLAKCEVHAFRRVLDMKRGVLERTFEAKMGSGRTVAVQSTRFCSMANDDIGAIRYAIKAIDFTGKVTITPYIDGDVVNQDANYDEKFWDGLTAIADTNEAYVSVATKKTNFHVCTGMQFEVFLNGQKLDLNPFRLEREKYAGCSFDVELAEGDELVVFKYAGILSSLNHPKEQLVPNCQAVVRQAFETGFATLLKDQEAAWAAKWAYADVKVEGDVSAQQGIRFNIFQLFQTYTGEDERLNIGPKGFTGEKYGGSTYWDTEAYCLPFYQATADTSVARNLLIYRYKHLQKAIENAEKLGFKDGAALYPMVTMNGEECHNEWEITFEEIHRNGAIAYAIFDYIRYTGDKQYLVDYGLEVLIGIARFWAQRVHFSKRRQQYVMHGVTGPNEYENNVNNNWYTNYIAKWCLQYALEAIDFVEKENPDRYKAIEEKIKFYKYTEINHWKEIVNLIYLPYDPELDVFVQHDGFLDKDLKPVSELSKEDRPINQNWSWDRILRSCFIKQADVLQGIYFFEEHFDLDTIRRNFEFYEPMTVHESSLSPCVHAILAARLGMKEKAYEMYVRTARLDLDDYNNDTEDGLHITSMAGTWMSIVKGFGGMQTHKGKLAFAPFMPPNWERFSFMVQFSGKRIKVEVGHDGVQFSHDGESGLDFDFFDQSQVIPPNKTLRLDWPA